MYNRDLETLFIEEHNDKSAKMYAFKAEALAFSKVHSKI